MSIQSPMVSVIISANNHNRYLLETINNVQQQTFTDFEVLICHGGNSLSLVKWFEGQQDPRLKLFLEENVDLVQMLNLAIKGARGKYIAFLQADDLWHPKKLEKQIFCLNLYPAVGLVHSWLTVVDEQSKPVGKILRNKLSGWVESEILQRNRIGYSSAIIRRDCLDIVGLFDSNLQTSFDWDLWIRLSRNYQFIAIAESLVYCCQHQDKIVQSWLTKEKDFHKTIEKAYQNLPKGLLSLKNCTYGYASLSLARQVLQSRDRDVAIVNHYCRQTLEYSPHLSFSREFIKISLAVFTLHCLKSDRYAFLLSLIQATRSWLLTIINKFKAFAHLLLNWMLKEDELSNKEQKIRDNDREKA